MPNHLNGIDHLVVLVRDLDLAAETYRRLGFTVSPRGYHSAHMGTANHTIIFRTTYLELMGVATPTDMNAGVRAQLAEREGPVATVLNTGDTAAASRALRTAGVNASDPIAFQRPVELPDGEVSEAAFTITRFDEPGSVRDGLFACSHLTPDLVWIPSLMSHPNGATGYMAIDAVASDPGTAAKAFEPLYGEANERGGSRVFDVNGVSVTFRKGDAGFRYTTATLTVENLSKTRQALVDVPHRDEGDCVSIDAAAAHGLALTFREA